MKETWKPIPDYPGYAASNYGRIRALERFDGRGHILKGKVLTPVTGSGGHLTVTLSLDGVTYTRAVHRLILEAFVGPRPDGMECCHNNGEPFDNRLSNLRWDTRSSNNLDRIAHNGLRTECHKGHPFPENLSPKALRRGVRRCEVCLRENVGGRAKAVGAAHRALGMTYRAYIAEYGGSLEVALRVAAGYQTKKDAA